MKLDQIDTLVASDFPEIGKPSGFFSGRAGAITAVAGTFGHLWWPARGLYDGQRLLYRLCVYGAHGELLALYDKLRYPINDIAIHPTLPLVALACGSYDGGMYLGGELLIFDWELKTAFSALLESREVTRCRFSKAGDELVILLHPVSDEEFGWDLTKAENTFYGCTLSVNDLRPAPPRDPLVWRPDPRLDQLTPITPSTLGFSSGVVRQENPGASISEWAAARGKFFEERHHVWDITWLPDGRLAYLHSDSLVEFVDFQKTGHTAKLIPKQVDSNSNADDFQSVQLHYSPGVNELAVHVVDFASHDWTRRKSILYHVGISGEVKTCREFNVPFTFSWNTDDHCLARNSETSENRQGETTFLINPDGKTIPLAIGHYDCFNHYIRLDDGRSLYFLQGTPPESHKGKYLCCLDPVHATWSRLWPVDMRPSADFHAMQLDGCLVQNGRVALAWIDYDPKPSHVYGSVACCELRSGRIIWQHPITAQAAAMAYMEVVNVIVCALVDGKLNIYDAATGSLLYSDEMIINDIPTIPMSLAVHENQVAVGTLDGRIVLYRFTADCG
ncbi:MAG: hypothetical protein ACYDCO_04650 [Armatimonadota bacterium]